MVLNEVVNVGEFYVATLVIVGFFTLVYLGLKYGSKINSFFYNLGRKV